MNNSKFPAILITGATGSIGSELTKQLDAKGIPFRALVRTAGSNNALFSLKNAEIIEGDFNNADSVARALKGIERAFLLTNSSQEAETLQLNFADIAKREGLKHIVKQSQLAADLRSPVRFLRYHAAVEQKIIQSGMAYTFLRPNLFMQGLLGFRETIAKQGKFFAAAGDAKISAIDTRDIAAVAVEALTNTGHENKIYNLTGPAALTHQQMAEELSKGLGRNIQFVNVSSAEMQQALIAAGFPLWQAEGLIEDYAHYTRGEASAISSCVQEVTGKSPRDFKNFVTDYTPAFLNE